jgi:acyl carrier protein
MQLETIVAQTLELPLESVTDDLSLDTCPAWTSMTHIALLNALESHYGITFEIEESIEMDSVEAIREVLEARGIALDA